MFFLKFCFLLNIVLMQTIFFQAGRKLLYPPLASFLTPFAVLFFYFNFTQSVFKTLWKNEITWRDTSYSLKELKKTRSNKPA